MLKNGDSPFPRSIQAFAINTHLAVYRRTAPFFSILLLFAGAAIYRIDCTAVVLSATPTPAQVRFAGRDAESRILQRFTDYPKARELASQVAAFYGPAFQFEENADLSSSHSVVSVSGDSLSFEHAFIALDADSGRETEALAHEVLHISQIMRGLPFEPSLTPAASGDFRTHWSTRNSLAAAVQHEIFVEEYVNLGFDRQKFLTRASAPDYENLARRHRALIALNASLAGPTSTMWSEMYMLFWMAARHGYDDAGAIAQETLRWGGELYPQLPGMAAAMREWVADGRFRDFRNYPRELDRLYAWAGIPAASQWVTLRTSSSGQPVAVPVAATDSR
jgi:hypothetical protein